MVIAPHPLPGDAPRARTAAPAGGQSPSEGQKAAPSAASHTELSARAELFKRLPPRLQGLLALGLLHSDKSAAARVVKAAPASPSQVQQLLPGLLQPGGGKATAPTSADLIGRPPTLVKLNLQGHQLITVSLAPVKVGDWLALRLGADGRLLARPGSAPDKAAANPSTPANAAPNNPAPPNPAAQSPAQILAGALRQSLPQQQGLQAVLGPLLALQKLSGEGAASALDAGSRMLLQQLGQSLSRPRQLMQPEPLRQAMGRSGLWQEAHLKTLSQLKPGAAPIGAKLGGITLDNLKTQLGRLHEHVQKQQQLYPAATGAAPGALIATERGSERGGEAGADKAIGQLLKQLLGAPKHSAGAEQAPLPLNKLSAEQRLQLRQAIWQRLGQLSQAGVSKIQTQQLQGLLDPGPGQRWFMELPFVWAGQLRSVEIDIQERPGEAEKKTGKKTQSQWQLRLAFDLPELGKVQADVRISGERGAIALWFDRAEANRLAQAELHSLRQALQQGGLELEELQCQQGLPPKLETSLQQQLISTRA